MTYDPPKWQAHESEGFDEAMLAAADVVVARLRDDPAFRDETLRDPRGLHSELFRDFAPQSEPAYAGTYRGTPGTSLEQKSVGAKQLLSSTATFTFEPPQDLPGKTQRFLTEFADELPRARDEKPRIQLLCLAELFCRWGSLHPFLDGNGHIQRLLFAAAAIDMGIPLSNRFAVHPRTYDALLAFPLEMYTRSSGGARYREMAAEYLSSWLAGPFDTPGSGIGES